MIQIPCGLNDSSLYFFFRVSHQLNNLSYESLQAKKRTKNNVIITYFSFADLRGGDAP